MRKADSEENAGGENIVIRGGLQRKCAIKNKRETLGEGPAYAHGRIGNGRRRWTGEV